MALATVAVVLCALAGNGAASERREAGLRIVGGYQSTSPSWLVSLWGGKTGDSLLCGASLIAPSWILTAAHCLQVRTPPNETYVALIGGTDLLKPEGFQRRVASKVVVHSGYDPRTFNNDIGLIKLATPSTLEPAKLNEDPGNERPGLLLSVMGWGVQHYEAPTVESRVRRVRLPVVKQDTCRSVMGFPAGQASTMCAGFRAGGKDACQGDSGGPFFIHNTVVGVVSSGYQCALPNYYGIYTRVSYHLAWIRAIMREQSPTKAGSKATAPPTKGKL